MLSRGMIYMLLATFIFAVMNVMVKYVTNIPAIEIILFRSIVSFFMSGITLKMKKINPLGKNRGILFSERYLGCHCSYYVFYHLTTHSSCQCCNIDVSGANFHCHFRCLDSKEKFTNGSGCFLQFLLRV